MSKVLLAALLPWLCLLPAAVPGGSASPPPIYDIVYGDYHPSLKFDWYAPDVSTGHDPALVFLHGGLPPNGNKSAIAAHYKEMLNLLRANGIGVAAVEFTPYPTYNFPDQLHDVQLAMQFLRENAGTYGLDPQRLGVWGVSSGALLAGWVAFSEDGADPDGTSLEQQSTSPQVCMGYDAITDFSLLVPTFTGAFFGLSSMAQVDPLEAQQASLTWMVCNVPREYTPPVFTIYGITYHEPPLDDEHDGYFGHVLEMAMRSCEPEANALSTYKIRDVPLAQLNRQQLEWLMERFGMPGPLMIPQKK